MAGEQQQSWIIFSSILISMHFLMVNCIMKEETEHRYSVKPNFSSGLSRAEKLLHAAINDSVDPCEDFFEFACSKWNAQNPIPSMEAEYSQVSKLTITVEQQVRALLEQIDSPSSSTGSIAIQHAKSIYHQCMNTAAQLHTKTAPLLKKVEALGFWPAVHGKSQWARHKFELTKLLASIEWSRDVKVFFEVSVGTDEKDVRRRVLHFDQGPLGLGPSSRNFYINPEQFAPQLNAYKRNQADKIRLFAKDAGILNVSDREIEMAVDEIFVFETKLATIQLPEEERRNKTRMYNLMRFSDLSTILPQIDWQNYFDSREMAIKNDPEVVVVEPEYFERLAKLLHSTEPHILANYIFSQYADTWRLQLGERFDDIQQELYKAVLGQQEKLPRWRECVRETTAKMHYATDALFVRKHFDQRSKKAVLTIVKDLCASMREMLDKNDWMDLKTKQFALEKLENIVSLIGFPDFIYNDTALDQHYKELIIDPKDSYAEITEKCWQWFQRWQFSRLQKPVDRFEFEMPSSLVNAGYSPDKNAIMFPAAFLQVPFFDADFPAAFNYGSIGSVIGHEITHGFDDQGSQFDSLGNLRNWWTPNTWQAFDHRTQCFVDQFSSFTITQQKMTMNVNGVNTKGENVADSGGLKEALKAFLRSTSEKLSKTNNEILGYTPVQLFYISFAHCFCGSIRPEALIYKLLTDPHSPNNFRVNGALINQPEFAAAFNCPKGSPMNPNPEKRCAVW